MDFLRQYALNIVFVSVLAVVFDIIMPPEGYKKYINVVVGLIVMMVIISPVRGIFSGEETFTLDMGGESVAELSIGQKTLVSEVFKKRLAENIEKEILEKKNIECSCEVSLSVNENGEIVEIDKIVLSPCSSELSAFVSETFGIEHEKIGGETSGY